MPKNGLLNIRQLSQFTSLFKRNARPNQLSFNRISRLSSPLSNSGNRPTITQSFWKSVLSKTKAPALMNIKRIGRNIKPLKNMLKRPRFIIRISTNLFKVSEIHIKVLRI